MVLFSYSSSPHKDFTIKVYRRRMTDNAQMLNLKNEFLIRLRSITNNKKYENIPWTDDVSIERVNAKIGLDESKIEM